MRWTKIELQIFVDGWRFSCSSGVTSSRPENEMKTTLLRFAIQKETKTLSQLAFIWNLLTYIGNRQSASAALYLISVLRPAIYLAHRIFFYLHLILRNFQAKVSACIVCVRGKFDAIRLVLQCICFFCSSFLCQSPGSGCMRCKSSVSQMSRLNKKKIQKKRNYLLHGNGIQFNLNSAYLMVWVHCTVQEEMVWDV